MVLEEVSIRCIHTQDPDYQKELELREAVLRKPLGLSLFERDTAESLAEKEKEDLHITAFIKEDLIASAILTRINPKEARLRQVAVKAQYQGKGIGRNITEAAEQYARAAGYQVIRLHARETAAGFYLKQGYQITGVRFMEVGIPHLPMGKVLPPCSKNLLSAGKAAGHSGCAANGSNGAGTEADMQPQ